MKRVMAAGKTVEEAIQSGLRQLEVSEDRVKVTVVEQPSKGLFGLIGSKDAKVELELIPDPVEEAVAFLQEVTAAMGLRATVSRIDDDEQTTIGIQGADMGIVIGRRGQTLDALQYLTNIVANRFSSSHIRLVLDAEDFRKRRRKTLEELAQRLASRVVKNRREVVLEPMSPQERKIIHSYLQNHPKVKTFSKGEEPNRKVVIAPK